MRPRRVGVTVGGVTQPDWSRLADTTSDPGRAREELARMSSEAPAALASVDPAMAPVLAAAVAGSGWVAGQLHQNPDWIPAVFHPATLREPRSLRAFRTALTRALGGAASDIAREPALAAVRRFHAREHLRIAVRDLARLAPMEEVTAELSDLAEACLDATLDIVTAAHEARFGRVWHRGPGGRWRRTGFAVIGLGKLGGWELNFSSDVDLLLLYEEEGVTLRTAPGPRSRPSATAWPGHESFRRLAADFVSEVARATPEGQLYRVDLRLRPEGDAGPLARSLASHEAYYAQWGQTWERLMLLKGRPVAGDRGLGSEFLDLVQPFRHPRFPSGRLPDEIAAAKLRLEREAVEGDAERDVKRGRGGIREIEFIVQAFQVLHGGRQPFLQTPNTLAALGKLAGYGLLDRGDVDALGAAYRFWRDIEHRLQMEANRQTHALPADAAARRRIARLMGFPTGAAFEEERTRHADRVRDMFDRLLAGRARPTADAAGLPGDFVGDAVRWEALLAGAGFTDAPRARRLLHAFVEGPGWAHVSARTGQFGRALVPRFLDACRRSPFPRRPGGPPGGALSDPDRVLARLDRFVTAYGSRAPLYETWISHPLFFALLLWLFDRSEFLGETAIRVPDLVEDMVRTDRLRRARTAVETAADLAHGAADPDQRLWIRRYQEAEQMRIGLRSLLGLADVTGCHRELTRLADACIAHALDRLRRRHRLRRAPFAVFGLGRLGGRELTFGSDLDLLLVAPDNAPDPGELDALAAELVDLLGGDTDIGRAYEVDLRLRPDGEAGPLVVPVGVLEAYHRERAQLWEIQALGRLRFVAGPASLGRKVEMLADRLTDFSRGNPGVAAWSADWRHEIGRMLGRIHRERTPAGREADAFKTGVGGLLDAEFLARCWSLSGGWREAHTGLALARAVAAGHLPSRAGRALLAAHARLLHMELVVRRWSGTAEAELPSDPAARRRVAIRCGHRDAEALAVAVGSAREVIRRAVEAADIVPPRRGGPPPR